MTLMRRISLSLAVTLLLLVGATDVSAQSIALNTSVEDTDRMAASTEATSPLKANTSSQSVVLKSTVTRTDQVTRRDIQRAMMADLSLPADENSAMQDDEGGGNRTLLYVAGGTLVAAGITTAIILLLSGDDDGGGIPGPPGRPN